MQIYIFSVAGNYPTTAEAVAQFRRLYADVDLHLVVPDLDASLFGQLSGLSGGLTVHPETHFAPGLNLAEIKRWPVHAFPGRASWYYQQFLKLSTAEHVSSNDRFLVWDGDTVPYRRMEFFAGHEPCFTLTEDEYHHPYFETNWRLLEVDRSRIAPGRSAISQHMPVVKSVMLAMLAEIERKSGKHWSLAIRDVIIGRSGVSLFSEYEIYFDYLVGKARFPHQVLTRHWYRKGGKCTQDQLRYLKATADFVTFERNHLTPSDREKNNWLTRWREIVTGRPAIQPAH